MGLDMYLTKRHYVKNWDYMKKTELHSVLVRKGGKKVDYINSDKISEVVEEVAYWRKANAIHKWFVENVQDGNDNCKDYNVSEDKLKELLDIVRKVSKNHKLANKLLPTEDGFFFGGTDYDKFYYEDLEYTKKMLEKEIELMKNKEHLDYGDYYYRASW